MAENGGGNNASGLFGIYLVATFDVYSFISSSPQTVELNAHKRAPTLMKYVNMGGLAAAGIGIMGSALAPKGLRIWPLLGAAGGITFATLIYRYAAKEGIDNPGAPTEEYPVTEIQPVYRGQAYVHAGG